MHRATKSLFRGFLVGRMVPNGFRRLIQKQKTVEDMPRPREFPLVGSLPYMIFHRGGLAKALIQVPLKRVRTFGKIYCQRLGPQEPKVHLANPSDVELLYRNEASYPERVKYDRQPGVFFLNGVEWQKHRSILGKRLLRPQAIAQYASGMNKISCDLINRIKTLRDTSLEVKAIDYELFKWSFDSVAFALFGMHFGSIAGRTEPKVNEFILSTIKFLQSIVPTVYFPPKLLDYWDAKGFKVFTSSWDKMYELAEFFILQGLRNFEKLNEDHPCTQNDGDAVCLLQSLSMEENLSREEILSSVIDLLFAGVETTSNTMQWVLYELAKNPDKQRAVFLELTSVLSGTASSRAISSRDLQRLPYLKAVIKETLRLHPVLNQIPRTLSDEMIMSGYKLPAKTVVNIMSYAMSRQSDLFVEPTRFEPERWLKEDASPRSKFHRFSSTPFGFGRRMCLGRRLAELEMHILLSHVVLNFHLAYPENETMETVSRGTLTPEKPARVKFYDRKYIH